MSAGSSASYSIQPDANYHITDVKVDGISVGPVTSSYTFKNVSADYAITISFDTDDTPTTTSPYRKSWRR